MESVERIIAFLVYVGAYAAIPFVAKRFGGILSQLTGNLNDRSRGVIDRPRNALRGFAQDRREGRRSAREIMRTQSMVAGKAGPVTKGRYALSRFRKGGSLIKRETQPEAAGEAGGRVRRRRRAVTDRFGQRRRTVNEIFTEQERVRFGEAVERAQKGIQSQEFEEAEKVALNPNEDLHRRYAAVLRLGQAGVVQTMRRIHQRAYETQATDPHLLQAYSDVRKTDDYFKAMKDSAPDLAKSAFADGKIVVEPKATFLTSASIKEVGDWDITTWRAGLGLDATIRAPKPNVPDVLKADYDAQARQAVLAKASEILGNKVLRGQINTDILKLLQAEINRGGTQGAPHNLQAIQAEIRERDKPKTDKASENNWEEQQRMSDN